MNTPKRLILKKPINSFPLSTKGTNGLSLIEDTDHIGSLYRKIRCQLRRSQKEIGNVINHNRNTVRQFEKGKRDLRFSEVLELAKYNNSFRVGAIAFLENIESKK